MLLLVCISCVPPDRSEDMVKLGFNGDGGIDVILRDSGRPLIRGLTAACQDSTGRLFIFPAGEVEEETQPFEDLMGRGTEWSYEAGIMEDHLGMRWVIRTFSDRAAVACRLEIKNRGSLPLRIERLFPLATLPDSGGMVMNQSGPLRYLDMEPETWMPKSLKELGKKGESKMITAIASPDQEGVVIGCLSFDRFRGIFEFEDKRDASGVLHITTRHDIDDHLRIDPGASLCSEWIYAERAGDVLSGLEHWADLAGVMNHAVISDPPATGFYTWYYYRESVSEKIMMENTRFLADNRDRFPVNFVHIDWGWQRHFSSGDTVPNEKFPHGLKWLATRVRDHGFTPSIWCNPFMYTYPTAEAVHAHPGIFRRDTAGELIGHEPIRNIMGKWWGADHIVSEGTTNVLDVSIPGTYDFLKERYQWVRSMGYGMAMMDFIIYGRNNYDDGDRLKYSNLSTFEGIRKSLSHAKDGLGPGGNILGCGAIYETIIGISNLTRISYDATANWKCVKVATTDLILQYFMNQRLWTNYADGLFVRDKASPYWGEFELDEHGNKIEMFLTDDEARFFTAVNGLSQAAVMYTEDIQKLKPERQWLLSMVLPIYQNGEFRPVDLFQSLPAKTLQLACREGNRKWIVAAGLNWTEQVDTNCLELSLLDLEEGQQYHAFDIFEQHYLGLVNAESQLGPVRPHAVMLVNLTPDSGTPRIIGTDLHISQGGVEIRNESWDGRTNILTIELKGLNSRKGHLFVRVPDLFAPVDESGYEIRGADHGKVLKVPVVLDKDKSLQIEFMAR